MYKFTVPDNYKEGFAILSLLDEEEIAKVLKTIEAAPAGTQLDSFIDLLTANLNISKHDNQELSTAIYSLINLRVDTKEDTNLIVKDLVGSFFDENEIEVDSSETHDIEEIRRNAEKNLLQIFQVQGALAQTIKGLGLLAENEKLFLNNRIITDIRLLFDSKDSSIVNGAVILHQMKITYHQNSQEKEFFISLDSADLNKLKENISRALEKEKLILKNGFSQNLQFINPIR